MREAARKFMFSVEKAGDNTEGFGKLYSACNSISALRYEGMESNGKIIIARLGHPNVRTTLQFLNPISIKEFRKVRKLLEISSSLTHIISDGAYIYGLGEQIGKYDPNDESLFIINFFSHYKWEVLHNEKKIMIVEYEQPSLPKERIDRDKFYSDLRRVFKGIEDDQINDLWDITREAMKQQNGTILVISDNALEEAKRLGQQGFPLKSFKITSAVIRQITAIDGSVLLDRNSICYAIGVILDGLATDKGDSSRGARYNSAIRYYEHFGKDQPTVLIIISEDGMINLVPNLRPQIEHSMIKEAIEKLKNLVESEKLDKKSFNKLMDLFLRIEFYLTQEECDMINILKKKAVEKDTVHGLKTLYGDLRPNEEMNSSYYKGIK